MLNREDFERMAIDASLPPKETGQGIMAHDLARILLAGPNLPVMGAAEGHSEYGVAPVVVSQCIVAPFTVNGKFAGDYGIREDGDEYDERLEQYRRGPPVMGFRAIIL